MAEKTKEAVNENVEELQEDAAKQNVEQEVEEQTEAGKEEDTKEEDEKEVDTKDPQAKKIEELNDKMMRTMAEFENFRKRSEKEKTQMFEIGAKSVIEKILPVMDNFERGLSSIEETEANKAVYDGMQMIYKQMTTVFEEIGVTPIEAVGKEFDPNLHNAVMAVEDEAYESNTICEEMQKGYMYKESVVRHSMVKVVN